jgi:tetratricopeptide (TPR) repeat protein
MLPAPLRLLRGGARRRIAAALLACAALGLGGPLAGCSGSQESRLEEIRALQDGGDHKRVLPLLEEFLAKDPDNPEANYRRGLAFISTGEPSKAVWCLRRVPVDGEFGVEAAVLLGTSHIRARNYEEAIATADHILEAHPDEIQALALRSKALIERNELEAALRDVDRIAQLEPGALEVIGMRGVLLQRMGKTAEARAVYEQYEKRAAEEKSPLAAYACLALAQVSVKGGDAMLAALRSCSERYTFGPKEASLIGPILDPLEKNAEATALLRDVVARNESNLLVRGVLVKRLLAANLDEEASAAIEPLAKAAKTAAEWTVVGNLQREAGKPEEALASYAKALELDPKQHPVRHVAADVMIQLGRYDEAEKAAAQLDDTLRGFVLGHLALARDDAPRALELLNASLLQWPGNEGARMLAARAALRLGRYDEGVAHLREAARASGGKGEPVLLLAQLYVARGDYKPAAQLIDTYVRKRTPDPTKVIEQDPERELEELPGKVAPEAYVLLARIGVAVRDYKGARAALDPLREEWPVLAAVEDARVSRAEKGPAAALAELEKQPIRWAEPDSELALRELTDLAIAAGKPERAGALLERLAMQHPDTLHVQVTRTLLCISSGDLAAAAAALGRAEAIAPESTGVIVAQGLLARAQGDLEKARARLELAVERDATEPSYQYELARVLQDLGQRDAAESRLRELLVIQPDHAPGANDLAWLLADRGAELPFAAELAERAVRQLPVAEVRDTLGYVQLKRGQHEAALKTLGKVAKERPDYATARYHLALALAAKGQNEEAQQELRAALSGPPFPEAEAAKLELARLEGGAAR